MTRPLGVSLALCIALVASSGPAAADDTMRVVGAWVRLPPPGSNAAMYGTFVNSGPRPIRVLTVHSGAAERAELHQSVVEDGVASMRPVGAIDVPAGESVSLAPGGLHVMLIGPRPFVEGQAVGLVFGLSTGRTLRVAAVVRRAPPTPPRARGDAPPGETAPEPDHSHH